MVVALEQDVFMINKKQMQKVSVVRASPFAILADHALFLVAYTSNSVDTGETVEDEEQHRELSLLRYIAAEPFVRVGYFLGGR